MKHVKHFKSTIGGLTAFALLISFLLYGGRANAAEQMDSGLLWLVNYDHRISADYAPNDLQGESGGLRAQAYASYQQMLSGLRIAGYSVHLASAYRSYKTQSYLFQSRLAERRKSGMSYDQAYAATRRYTAVPGTSEHQLGLAADLTTGGQLTSSFANTGAGKWLYANCSRYGFIRRYAGAKEPLTQIADEAWHFRYIGIPHAQIITENGWCLEEYLAYLRKSGAILRDAGNDMAYEIIWSSVPPADLTDAIDFSSDNMGGYITTRYHSKDPLVRARGHWSESYLKELFSRGDMPWLGMVNPDAPISRGAFAVLYAELPLPQGGAVTVFSDVPEGSPLRSAVDKLSAAGVLSGSEFFPDRLLTRQEAAVFAARLLPHKQVWLDYADTGSIPGWAFQAVQQVTAYNIMAGKNGRFCPADTITWGEAAALLCRLKDVIAANE